MDQDETWRGGMPWPRPRCVRWGPSSALPKGAQPPIVDPCLLWPNDWLDQDATWYGGRPRPRRYCVRWGPISPQKGGTAAPPLLGPCIVAKRLDGSRCHLLRTTEVGLGPGHIVLDGDPVPIPQKKDTARQFLAHVCCGQMAGLIKMPFGTEVGLGPGDIVLDGDPATP